MHQGGRAAAVEVDRALRAQRDHHLGELGHREAAVDARAAAVTGDGHDEVVCDPERRTGMPALRDVGVELPGTGREALAVVLPVEGDLAARDEQRPGLDEVSRRRRRRVLARDEVELLALDRHARPARGVRRRNRLVVHRATVDPELAERAIGVSHEEAADDRLVDVVRGAPDVQALRAGEVHHAHTRRRAWVPDGIERGHVTVGELVAPQQVLDPVSCRPAAHGDIQPCPEPAYAALPGFDFPNLEDAGRPPLDTPARRIPGRPPSWKAAGIEAGHRTETEQP